MISSGVMLGGGVVHLRQCEPGGKPLAEARFADGPIAPGLMAPEEEKPGLPSLPDGFAEGSPGISFMATPGKW